MWRWEWSVSYREDERRMRVLYVKWSYLSPYIVIACVDFPMPSVRPVQCIGKWSVYRYVKSRNVKMKTPPIILLFLVVFRIVSANLVPRSCNDIVREAGNSLSFQPGVFTIDPDGPGGVDPFQVTCATRFDLPGHGVTLISHQGGLTPQSQLFRGPGSPIRLVTYKYSATREQIEGLIRVSEGCRQFVQLQCHEAQNFQDNAWWTSRQGWYMRNWGGAPAHSARCACAMQGRCDNPSYNCNCAIADGAMHNDEGYLEDKHYLPVKNVYVIDVDQADEYAAVTVKPLECYGDNSGKNYTERCHCRLHAEDQSAGAEGPLLLELPDLIYGQNQGDVRLDLGHLTPNVVDVYPTFFNTRREVPYPNDDPDGRPECSNAMANCHSDCERLAKFRLASTSLKATVGAASKPLGQIMCENAGETFPPPGRRILAFAGLSSTCVYPPRFTQVLNSTFELCCNVYSFAYNQQVHLYNANCPNGSKIDDMQLLFG